jgi:predicted metal-binding membrane protein
MVTMLASMAPVTLPMATVLCQPQQQQQQCSLRMRLHPLLVRAGCLQMRGGPAVQQ